MYIVKCQQTEMPIAYYFSGFSEAGEALYSTFLARACRYPTIIAAEQVVQPLLRDRAIIRYIIEPEEFY